MVDTADYNRWSEAFGQLGLGLAADGDGDGGVNAADYTLWRDNLGLLSQRHGKAWAFPNLQAPLSLCSSEWAVACGVDTAAAAREARFGCIGQGDFSRWQVDGGAIAWVKPLRLIQWTNPPRLAQSTRHRYIEHPLHAAVF